MQTKLFTLCLALCAVCFSATSQNVPDYVPTDGLVAWYPLNGNANDESGNGNNGDVIGALPTIDRLGQESSAYSFNGSNQYIGIEDTPQMLPSQISLSAWVKIPSEYTANEVGRVIRSRFFGYTLTFMESNQSMMFELYTNSSSVSSVSTSAFPVNDDEWHHFVGTFDGQFMLLYSDGVNIGSVETPNDGIFYSSDGLVVLGKDGNNTNPSTAHYQGDMDDVGIWNRSLTEEEVLGLYDAGINQQNICESIGNDSIALYSNGYIIGPQLNCGLNIHTDSKWINVTGADSLHVFTFQHRFYDQSAIYDENNNLIWNWDGESIPSDTWYPRNHSVNVSGNDSVRIEFYQGYNDPFCVGFLQVVGMACEVLTVPGCTDSIACNFNEEANEDDDTCIYPLFGEDCEMGGAACGDGTVWDASIQACVCFNDCPSDVNGNGNIEVSDVLTVLVDFGLECPPEVQEWTCGDPVNYHSYEYGTVQIGGQCWFKENLRNEHYANGETIPSELNDGEWSSTTNGAMAVFGEGTSAVTAGSDDEVANLANYGRLYNWYAVDDAQGLCPSGWHVPTDGEFMTLEMELGMSESQANQEVWRGTDQGTQMKSSAEDSPSWNGTNTSSFSGLAGGSRDANSDFSNEGSLGYFWSASATETGARGRELDGDRAEVSRSNLYGGYGFSVRCVRD